MNDENKNSGPCDGPELVETATEQTPATGQTDSAKMEPSQAPTSLDLNEVFVSVVSNAQDTTTKTVPLATVLESVGDGQHKRAVEDVREAYAKGGKKAAAPFKQSLPGAMFSGVFTVRKNVGLKIHSGILCADLDELGDRLAALKALLVKDQHVLAVFISPSGNGLKVLLRIPPDSARHKDAFLAAHKYFQWNYSVEIDQACKDLVRLCFLSHDPDIHINPAAVPLHVPDEAQSEPAPADSKPAVANKSTVPTAVARAGQRVSSSHARRSSREDRQRSEWEQTDLFAEIVWDAVRSLDPDCGYDHWLKIGMALRRWDSTRSLAYWVEWSKEGKKFQPGECENKWESFNDEAEGVTLGTLFHWAKTGGWQPDELIVSLLVALPPLECDRHLRHCAGFLGVEAGTLKMLLAERRAEAASNKTLSPFSDVEPWPDPVDGGELLLSLEDIFSRRVILPTYGTVACALWVLHTYCYTAFVHTPRLHTKSPTKRCGKTVLLTLLAKLTSRAMFTSDLSAAVLFRVIERIRPTVLIDEWDSMAFGDKGEALRNVLNSGFQSDGMTWRVERKGSGGFEPHSFPTFAPVVVAGIGDLPETVADRSIMLTMRRKLPHEKTESIRGFDGLDWKRKCRRWALDNMDALAAARPTLPRGLNDRQADCWEPLLAIADLAGGDWPEVAREAVLALSQPDAIDDESAVALLADIRRFFEIHGGDRAFCADVHRYLIELPDAPWANFNRGQPMTRHKLGRMLSAFGIVSGTIREDDRTDKGWHSVQFTEVWRRYLPTAAPDGSAPTT